MGALLGATVALGLLLSWAGLTDTRLRSDSRPLRWWATRRRQRTELLRQAGFESSNSTQLVAVQVGCGLAVGAVVLLISSSLSIAGCFGCFGAATPIAGLNRLRHRRRLLLRELWPEAVDQLSSAVRAGMSLPEGLAALGVHGPAPLRPAFSRFGAAYRLSGRFATCLDLVKADLADPIADRICETVRVAREVGGSDLGTVLRSLSELLRIDARIRAELEARQSWTINAARLSVAAPWVVLLLLASQPATLSAYDSPTGALLLGLGGAVCLIAYRVMLRIGRLPHEPRVLR